jgi:hypothetical protein
MDPKADVDVKPKDGADPGKGTAKPPADAPPKDAAPKDPAPKDVAAKPDDDPGELGTIFDDPKDKGADGKEKAPEKAADLKFNAPDDLKELFGDGKDYLAFAKEHGLDQKKLDALTALQADRMKAAIQESEQEAEKMSLEWRRDLASDAKLGGAKLSETMRVAERGARALGGSTLAVALAKHLRGEDVIPGPMLVRALHMAGLAQNEDRIGERGGPIVKEDDSALTPTERDFKAQFPATWKKMQEERRARSN